MSSGTDRFTRFQERYQAHDIPWDHELPPPEVCAIAEGLPAGRILDLGCGTGRTCIYLAARGWQADGIDFIPEAISMAQERVDATQLTAQIRLFVGSVTQMDFLQPPYDLAIDIGCMHGLADEELAMYASEITRLVRPGGIYLLFAHLRNTGGNEARASLPDERIRAVFSPGFNFDDVTYGTTTVGENHWQSAWYTLRRLPL